MWHSGYLWVAYAACTPLSWSYLHLVNWSTNVAIFVVFNILTRFQLCVLYVQVFFIPDSHDRTWKVDVQKEARSRRVVEAGDEAILNGVGVYNALEAGDVEGGGEVGGDIVDVANVERAQIRFSRGERARARAVEECMMN